MYTANLKNLMDLFDNELPANWKTSSYKVLTNYDLKELEDGKQELTLSVLGHDPKDISVEAVDDKITIKATKPEGSSSLINDIDLSFSVSKDYDGTKTEARFNNGLLVLTIDKKQERKSKKVTIKVG